MVLSSGTRSMCTIIEVNIVAQIKNNPTHNMENFQDDMQKHEKQPLACTPLHLLTKFHNMKFKTYIKLPFVNTNVGFGSPFAS